MVPYEYFHRKKIALTMLFKWISCNFCQNVKIPMKLNFVIYQQNDKFKKIFHNIRNTPKANI